MTYPEPPDPRRAVPRRIPPAGSDDQDSLPTNPGRHRQRQPQSTNRRPTGQQPTNGQARVPRQAAPQARQAPQQARPAPAAQPARQGRPAPPVPAAYAAEQARSAPAAHALRDATSTSSAAARRSAVGSPPASKSGSDRFTLFGPGRKPKRGRRRREAFWRELPMLILAALVLTFLIQTFLAKVYVIPSGSMETTLHGCDGCNNDRVIVDKISYRFTDPAPGDVVVFEGPNGWRNEEFRVQQADNWFARGLQGLGSLIGLAPPDEKDFVKRVIAVGGQSVSCCDSQQRVLVDGIPLNEPYVHYAESPGPTPQIKFGPVTIPQGSIWVMGDARDNSADSRVAGHGPVPVANVIGKARLIVLPFHRFGGIPDTNPQVVASGGPQATSGLPLALGLVGSLPLVIGRRRWLEGRSADARWLDPGWLDPRGPDPPWLAPRSLDPRGDDRWIH